MGNYCSGDYYFLAHDLTRAQVIADEFQKRHNEKARNNTNYTIEWDEEGVREFNLDEEGYIPLNRISVDVQIH